MSTDLNAPHDPAKHAIDLRLDAIDRALLGWLPRHERIEIVGQIETKLRESAGASTAGGTLDDIARDRADRHEERLDSAGDRSAIYLRERPFLARRKPRSRLAVSSGVLGIAALALLATLPFIYVLVSMLDLDGSIGGFLLCGQLAAVALCGLLAVVLGIAGLVVLSRHAGRLIGHGWAITGLCTGPLPVFAGSLVALAVGSQLWDSVTVQPAYSTVRVTPQPSAVAADPYAVPQPASAPSGSYPAPSDYPQPTAPQSSAVAANPYAAPSSPHVSPEQPPVPDALVPSPSASPSLEVLPPSSSPAVDDEAPSAPSVR